MTSQLLCFKFTIVPLIRHFLLLSNFIIMTYLTPGSVIAVSVVFPLPGAIAVALHFYTRDSWKARFATDGWLVLLALVRSNSKDTCIDLTEAWWIGLEVRSGRLLDLG